MLLCIWFPSEWGVLTLDVVETWCVTARPSFQPPSLIPPSSQLAHVLIAVRDPSLAIPQAHAALETKMRQLDRGRNVFHNLAIVYSQVSPVEVNHFFRGANASRFLFYDEEGVMTKWYL